MEWSSGAGTQSYIYLLQQWQEQRLTREAGGGKAEAGEGIKVSAHTGVAPCTGVEESPHWCCTSHNTCCSDCKCSGIGCIRGRNRGISISHHLPSRHSTKKPCSLQRKSEHLDQRRKWGVLKLTDLPWPIQGELAIGKGDLLTPSPNFAIKEDLGAEMWKGIRAHKDLNLNLTPAGGGEGQGLEWRWSHPAENYWHSCILLKGLEQDMSGYYCALDCVISGRLGYVRRYPRRFSCGLVEAHNKSEPVTCTLPTPVEETSQLLFDVTLLQCIVV